jgi:hypothetical protein
MATIWTDACLTCGFGCDTDRAYLIRKFMREQVVLAKVVA